VGVAILARVWCTRGYGADKNGAPRANQQGFFHSWRRDLKNVLQKRRKSLIFIFRSFNQLIFIGFYFCPKNSHSVTAPHMARDLAEFPCVTNKVIHRNCE